MDIYLSILVRMFLNGLLLIPNLNTELVGIDLVLSSLITAYARMFKVVFPYILIWTTYSLKIFKDS